MTTTATKRGYTYPFTEDEFWAAVEEWGCNCGPSALAFALQIPLDEIRGLIPDFETKGYTSPTMMKAALKTRGVAFDDVPAPSRLVYGPRSMFHDRIALVRIQWTGPWTAPGSNPRWAYGRTHWICAWLGPNAAGLVFDCNGGAMPFDRWKREIVPALTASYKRADGGWYLTHVWRLP